MSDKMKREFLRPLIQGALVAIATQYFYPDKKFQFSIIDINPPGWLAQGAFGFVAGVSAETIHQYVMPHIIIDKKLEHQAAMALAFISSGLVYYGANYVASPSGADQLGMQYALIAGGGSDILSEYIYQNYVDVPAEGNSNIKANALLSKAVFARSMPNYQG